MKLDDHEGWLASIVLQRRNNRCAPYPTTKRNAAAGSKVTNRAAITTALSSGKALGTSDIFRGVQMIIRDAVQGSIASEISRMKKEKFLVERGRGARGPLYALVNGGANAPALI